METETQNQGELLKALEWIREDGKRDPFARLTAFLSGFALSWWLIVVFLWLGGYAWLNR